MKEKVSITIDRSILRQIDSIVDNVYIRNRSQAIEYLARISLGENKTAIILAGGEEKNQQLDEGIYRSTYKLGKFSLAELAIKKLVEDGFKTVYIIARQGLLVEYFSQLKDGASFGAKINYIEEKESQGTFSSLKLAKGKLPDRFLVLYSDIIFNTINLKSLWESHIRSSSMSTLMLTTSQTPIDKGSVIVEGTRITGFNQKNDSMNNLVFSPIFVCEKESLEEAGISLEMDLFPSLAKKGLLNGYITSIKEVHIHTMADVKVYCR